MTAAKADDEGLRSLKELMCTAAMGTQADNCTKMTKAIAECVGRVHGNEMQQLVLCGTDSTPTEVACPDGTSTTDKEKAIQSKRCNLFLKQEVQHKDCKAKAFAIFFGQSNKAMKNRVEADSSHSAIESTTDMAKWLQLIEGVAHNANERKCPMQQNRNGIARPVDSPTAG